ncbi:MAG TPA: nucleoside deaminase [Turneriella sp.]|nr:nucleoside deaminase [Turneriella sp.]
MLEELLLRSALSMAYNEAEMAFAENEVPVGAVIIYNNEIIARDHNRIVAEANALRHAELLVIERAAKLIKNERLTECHLVTTLEPCMMCSGAVVWSRLASVHFLSEEERSPGLRSLLALPNVNHKPQLYRHRSDEWDAASLMRRFFQMRRTED